jgi:hypothetical protein
MLFFSALSQPSSLYTLISANIMIFVLLLGPVSVYIAIVSHSGYVHLNELSNSRQLETAILLHPPGRNEEKMKTARSARTSLTWQPGQPADPDFAMWMVQSTYY